MRDYQGSSAHSIPIESSQIDAFTDYSCVSKWEQLSLDIELVIREWDLCGGDVKIPSRKSFRKTSPPHTSLMTVDQGKNSQYQSQEIRVNINPGDILDNTTFFNVRNVGEKVEKPLHAKHIHKTNYILQYYEVPSEVVTTFPSGKSKTFIFNADQSPFLNPTSGHFLTYFNLTKCLMLAPVRNDGIVANDISHATALMGAMSIATFNASVQHIAILIPVGPLKHKRYLGKNVYVYETHKFVQPPRNFSDEPSDFKNQGDSHKLELDMRTYENHTEKYTYAHRYRYVCDVIDELPHPVNNLDGIFRLFQERRKNPLLHRSGFDPSTENIFISVKYSYSWSDWDTKTVFSKDHNYGKTAQRSDDHLALAIDALPPRRHHYSADPLKEIQILAIWPPFHVLDLVKEHKRSPLRPSTAPFMYLSASFHSDQELNFVFTQTFLVLINAIKEARKFKGPVARRHQIRQGPTLNYSDHEYDDALEKYSLSMVGPEPSKDISLDDSKKPISVLNSSSLSYLPSIGFKDFIGALVQDMHENELDALLVKAALRDLVSASYSSMLREDVTDSETINQIFANNEYPFEKTIYNHPGFLPIADSNVQNAGQPTWFNRLTFYAVVISDMHLFSQVWSGFLRVLEIQWINAHVLEAIPFNESSGPNLDEPLLVQKLQMINCCISRRIKWNHSSKRDVMGKHTTKVSELSDIDLELGRVRKVENLYLLNSQQAMYQPLLQDMPLVTKDILEHQQTAFEAEGVTQEDRAEMQAQSLTSDMQAFKAANPGCCMEDFVRWFSPSDFILDKDEENLEKSKDNENASQGRLSDRMSEPGNLWRRLWDKAVPLAIWDQEPVFNHTTHGEQAIQELLSMPLSTILRQLALFYGQTTLSYLYKTINLIAEKDIQYMGLNTVRDRKRLFSQALFFIENTRRAIDTAAQADLAEGLGCFQAAAHELEMSEKIVMRADSIFSKFRDAVGLANVTDGLCGGLMCSIEDPKGREHISKIAKLENVNPKSVCLPDTREFIFEADTKCKDTKYADRMYAKLKSKEFRLALRTQVE